MLNKFCRLTCGFKYCFLFLCFLASPPCLGLSLQIGTGKYQTLKKGFSPNDLCNGGANERKKRSAQELSSKIRPSRLRSKPQTGDKFGDTVILNYRPIFVNCELDECIWFDDNRYWRKGACDSVGAQKSNADCFSQQDISCPTAISCWTDCKAKIVRVWVIYQRPFLSLHALKIWKV